MKEKKEINEKKKRAGRPSLWKEEYVRTVRRLCILGATEDDIANAFGVTTQTIWSWKKQYPQFKKAIIEGKIGADTDVAVSLYKSAIGFYNKETKVFIIDDKPVKVEIEKYNPPNPTSAIFFLKNRRPDLWTDKRIVQNVDKDDQIEEIKRVIIYPNKGKNKDQEI